MLLNVLDHTRIQPGATDTFLSSCKVSCERYSTVSDVGGQKINTVNPKINTVNPKIFQVEFPSVVSKLWPICATILPLVPGTSACTLMFLGTTDRKEQLETTRV